MPVNFQCKDNVAEEKKAEQQFMLCDHTTLVLTEEENSEQGEARAEKSTDRDWEV